MHGCEQGDFKYSWVADGKQISGTASCTIDEDCSSLTLTVTPVAKKAPYEGDAVTVSISLPESDTKLVISGGSSGRGSGGSGGIVSVSGAADKLITSAEKEYKDSQKPQITVSDIDGHWAQESIIFAVENEIMSCDEENNFKPQNFATRAGVISAVAKAAGVAETAYTEEFGDVSEKDEFSGYLQSLVEMGVISRDAFFRPNDNITREEMCKVLTTLLGREKDGVTGEEAAHFSDRDQMGEWAVPYICCAISEKLMLGVSETEFSPKGKVTNAQLATLCKRISDSKGGQEN